VNAKNKKKSSGQLELAFAKINSDLHDKIGILFHFRSWRPDCELHFMDIT
jgi:hypothetical protein